MNSRFSAPLKYILISAVYFISVATFLIVVFPRTIAIPFLYNGDPFYITIFYLGLIFFVIVLFPLLSFAKKSLRLNQGLLLGFIVLPFLVTFLVIHMSIMKQYWEDYNQNLDQTSDITESNDRMNFTEFYINFLGKTFEGL